MGKLKKLKRLSFASWSSHLGNLIAKSINEYTRRQYENLSNEEKEILNYRRNAVQESQENKKKDKTWYENALSTLFGDSTTDYLNEWKNAIDIVSQWNLFHEKRTQSELSSAENELRNTENSLSDIEYATQYMLLLKDMENTMSVIGDNTGKYTDRQKNMAELQYNQQLEDLYKRLEYIKTYGKQSKVLREMFFDPNKADFNTNLHVFDRNFGLSAETLRKNEESDWYDLGQGLESVLERVGNIGQTIYEGVEKILPEFVTGKTYGKATMRALETSAPEERTFDKLFESYDGKTTGSKSIGDLNNVIDRYKDYYNNERKQKSMNVSRLINNLANGSSSITPFGTEIKFGRKWWDPKDIDPEFKNIAENTSVGMLGGIINPQRVLLQFPEVGSSWSDVEDFVGLMATDKAVQIASKQIVKFGLKKNPYTRALFMAGLINDVESAKKVVKGAKGFESVINLENRLKTVNAALGTAAVTSNIYLTKEMRRNETNAEIMDAYSNRVLQNSYLNNIDLGNVLEKGGKIVKLAIESEGYTKDEAERMYNSLDALGKIQAIIAYNAPTGDKLFEQLKHEARKGLAKVENDNNTLALMDYWEAFPFMDYTKTFLKDALSVSKAGRLKGVTNQIETDMLKRAANESAYALAENRLARLSNKIFKDPAKKLQVYHTLGLLGRKAKLIVPMALKESVEEGQQLLLQSRYTRGEYDDYIGAGNMFNLPSILEDLKLGQEAVGAYLGINYGDPDNGDDELQKAMEIGATTALFFNVPGAIINNLSRDSQVDNLRNYIKQMRTDKSMHDLLSSTYGKIEDLEHIGIFFDQFAKRGVDKNTVAKALLDFKFFKGDLVDNKYIDDDISLSNTTWNVYKNPMLNKILDDMNIVRNSESHKHLVQRGVKAILDTKNVTNRLQTKLNTIQDFKNSIIDAINQSDIEDTVLENLKQKIDNRYEQYKKLTEDQNENLEDAINVWWARTRNSTTLSKDPNVIKEAEKRTQLKINSGEVVDYYETLQEEIDNIISDKDALLEIMKSKSNNPEKLSIQKIISKEDYTKNYLDALFEYHQIKLGELLVSLLKDQSLRIKLINQELGTDLNPNSLLGMIEYILDTLNDQKNNQDTKDLISGIEEDEIQLNNQNEINQELQSEFYLAAMKAILDPIADAYHYGSANPAYVMRYLRPVKWTELSQEQRNDYIEKIKKDREEKNLPYEGEATARALFENERQRKIADIKELKLQYKLKLNQIKNQAEHEKSIGDEADLKHMEEKAAKILIEADLADSTNRRKIAHQNYIQSQPITSDDVIEAEQGNQDALNKIDNIAQLNVEGSEGVVANEANDPLDLIPESESIQQESEDAEILENSIEGYVDQMLDNDVETEAEKRAKQAAGIKTDELIDKEWERLNEKLKELNKRSKELNDSESETQADEPIAKESIKITPPQAEEKQQEELQYAKELNEDQLPAEEPYHTESKLINNNETNLDTSDLEGDSIEVNNDNYDTTIDINSTETEVNNEEDSGNLNILDFDDPIISDQLKSTEEEIIEYESGLDVLDIEQNGIHHTGTYNGEIPSETNSQNGSLVERNFVEKTFFYDPNATKPVSLKIDEEAVKLPYDLHSGKELAKKLIEPGWISKCKKYYVVTKQKQFTDLKNPNSFVVALIIQDDENKVCYATFLRQPGYKQSGGSSIEGKLTLYGIDEEEFIENLEFSIYLYYGDNVRKKPKDSASIIKWLKEARDWYYKLSADDKNKIDIEEKARWRSRIEGMTPLSHSEIQHNLEKLKLTRKEIIEAYCTKNNKGEYILPKEIRTDVQPNYFNISNGSITTKHDEEGKQVYTNLTGKESGYGISDDIDELSKQIENGDVLFGYGRKKDGPSAHQITDVRSGLETQVYSGFGHPGKIYWVHKGISPNAVDSTTSIMLHEERFKKQEQYNGTRLNVDLENPTLLINPVTGKIDTSSEMKPSSAEILLYLITGRLNASELPKAFRSNAQEIMSELANMFIHYQSDTNGNDNILLKDSDQYKHPDLALKQIAWVNNYKYGGMVFVIGDCEYDLETGKPINIRKQYYSPELIFNPTDDSTRKHIVSLIAKNMHWNTDLGFMNGAFGDESTFNLMNGLKLHFEDLNVDSWKLCGIDQFTFNKNDLFVTKNNNLTRRSTPMLSWLLVNGKLSTTTDKNIFRDPFVYAKGIKNTTASQKAKDVVQEKQVIQKSQPSVIESKTVSNNTNEEAENRIALRFGRNKEQAKKLFAHTQEQKNEILSQFDNTPAAKKHNKMHDIIILDANIKLEAGKTLQDLIKESINKYIEENNKISDLKLNADDIIINSLSAQTTLSFRKGGLIPVLYVYKDGSGIVSMQSPANILTSKGVTGVFSKHKASDKPIDVQKTKLRISKMLGIPTSKTWVIDTMMRSCTNEGVFGLANIAYDTLSEKYIPYMFISKQAGSGIEYHEAFHIVNLLMHSRQERLRIYKYYVKLHPEHEHTKFGEIEELIADEFMHYMQFHTDNSAKGLMRRFWNNLLDVLIVSRRKNQLRQLFNNIKSNKYAKLQLDQASVQQFLKLYPDGANYTIPGNKQEVTDKISNVFVTPQEYYDAAYGLAQSLLDHYSISRISDIRAIQAGNTMFTDYLKELLILADNELDPNKLAKLQAVIDNPDSFVNIIRIVYGQYGLDPKFKKFKQFLPNKTEENKNSISKKEADDYTYGDEENAINNTATERFDLQSFAISLKDNVAGRAKLFMSLVPILRKQWDENLNKYVYENEINDLFGGNTYWSYGQAWNKILNYLHSCETYDERDPQTNELKRTSLMYMVNELAKSDTFFEALRLKLEDDTYILDIETGERTPDIELLNLILTTIKCQIPNISQIDIADEVKHNFRSSLIDELGDETSEYGMYKSTPTTKERMLSIKDDNRFKAMFRLPREWSKNAILNGLVQYNAENKTNTVSEKYVNDLLEKMNTIVKLTDDSKKHNRKNLPLTIEDKIEACQIIKTTLLGILNNLGISLDELAFDLYVSHNIPNNQDHNDINNVYKAYQKILSKSEKKHGNIRYIIETVLKKSIGSSDIIIPGRKDHKPIDQLFEGTSIDSEVRKMAVAYDEAHPSSSDRAVNSPNGESIYPVTLNNYMSDSLRWLNNTAGERARELMSDPYARHSLLLGISSNFVREDIADDDKIQFDYFTGMKDSNKNNGFDYFGITTKDDYVAKMVMTFNNLLTLPTMADKKTWYAIKHKLLQLPHDLLLVNPIVHTIEDFEAEDVTLGDFSDKTIGIFSNYFLDEIKALKLYYSRENIAYYVKHQKELVKNYHGKVKNGRMDFSGNGGKFRYFYDVNKLSVDSNANAPKINLNQWLEYQYNLQKSKEADPTTWGPVSSLREKGQLELDGFELVRKTLDDIENTYFKDGQPNYKLVQSMSYMLRGAILSELDELSQDGVRKLITKTETGKYISENLPLQFLQYYQDEFNKNGLSDTKGSKPYSKSFDQDVLADLTYSVVGNHLLSSIISFIEIEKVFTGDPAFFKYQTSDIRTEVSRQEKGKNGKTIKFVTSVENITDKFTDKIKRFGTPLSTGGNIRTNYSEEILSKYPELRAKSYTNLLIRDINTQSSSILVLKDRFKVLQIVNLIRTSKPNWFTDFKTKYFAKSSTESVLDKIYLNEKLPDSKQSVLDILYKKYIPKLTLAEIDNFVNEATGPYQYDSRGNGINVSDAEVLIRPAFYRKCRIGIGQWTFEEDETGYSDEKAYQIIESDPEGNWKSDPEKCRIVSKLELYPLKMAYYSNNSVKKIGKDGNIISSVNKPTLNKMAIFPWFRFTATSTTGLELYNRMNMQGNELDMISFESAVKVGMNQGAYSPFGDQTDNIAHLQDGLNKESDNYIDENGKECSRVKLNGENNGEFLPVLIQRIDGLRYQLNTEAHHSAERSIGTLMFKLIFSNIIDDTIYGLDKSKDLHKKGSEIRHDIMSCVEALTLKGVTSIEDRFFNDKGFIKSRAVRDLITLITQSNGLGPAAQSIIANGGVAASVMSRSVYEQSVTSIIESMVVDVNTKGGTAIQQSMFGFVGYDNRNVITQQAKNKGKTLQYITKDGSMEVMLSMNFFKLVLPNNLKDASFTELKQWLIDNDIIKGQKSKSFGEKVYSHPNPFGIGYRIPTQGQSSMFSFVVADVLEEQCGDLIIVPEEFTAQTGSDFDVDKLYLATLSYTNGKYDDIINWDEIKAAKNDKERTAAYIKNDSNAISNVLIQNYITILSDIKMFLNTKASIDALMGELKGFLKHVRTKNTGYLPGLSDLSPSFLSKRKEEFSTGKDGISPFALSVTNLALTQYIHLCMDYGDNEFNLGNLDEIIGQDKLYISDWLSVLVSVHVDVAKDPFIFNLNVNKATYKYMEFLIRAGKGLSAFKFIAQPILKKYASLLNNAGGVYNTDNLSAKFPMSKQKKILSDLLKVARTELAEAYKSLDGNSKKIWKDRYNSIKGKPDENTKWSDVFDTVDINGLKLDLSVISLNPEYASLQELKLTNEELIFINKYIQVLSLESLKKLTDKADELSELVQLSQIDTKKFGNTITKHIDFENKLNLFIYNRKNRTVKWYINDSKNAKEKQAEIIEKNGVSYPLRKYFNSTFLMSKFMNTTNLVRKILSHELYTATPEYKLSLIALLGAIGERVPYEIQKTSKEKNKTEIKTISMIGYKPFGNEDTVVEIGQALDNLIRFNVIDNKAYEYYKKYNTQEDEDEYRGEVDLTCGNDIGKVKQKLHDLIYGNPESEDRYYHNSIFVNLAALLNYILKNPSSEEAENLVSYDVLADEKNQVGVIINELLNYLTPQPANERFQVGRFLLKRSLMNLSDIEKSRMISAFEQLLEHPSIKVRRLARDIAFYAYYSTYDTNTVNSFFELVPSQYRKSYDMALKRGLKKSEDLKKAIDPDGDTNLRQLLFGKDSNFIDTVLDIICRNYWYNNDIVPFYDLRDQPVFDIDTMTSSPVNGNLTHNQGEIRKLMFRTKNRNKFFGVIFTTYANGVPFFKVSKGGEIYLYKKLGTVLKTLVKQKPESDENKKTNSSENQAENIIETSVKETNYDVYVCVPKLGVHNGVNHQYEFFYDDEMSSVFLSENKLPDIFSPKSMIDTILSVFEYYKKDEESYGLASAPEIKISNAVYFETDRSSTKTQIFETSDNAIRFIFSGENWAKNRANLIIDINSEANKTDKVNYFSIDSKKPMDRIVEKLIKKGINQENSENSPFRIYLDGNFEDIKVTKREIEEYEETQIRKYKNRLITDNPDTTKEMLNESIQRYTDTLKTKQNSEYIIKYYKANKFVNDLLQTLIANNISIMDLYFKDGTLVGKAVGNVAHLLKQTQPLPTLYNMAYALVDGNLQNASKFEELLTLIESYESFDDTILSESEQELQKDMDDSANDAIVVAAAEISKQTKKELGIKKQSDEIDYDSNSTDFNATDYNDALDISALFGKTQNNISC